MGVGCFFRSGGGFIFMARATLWAGQETIYVLLNIFQVLWANASKVCGSQQAAFFYPLQVPWQAHHPEGPHSLTLGIVKQQEAAVTQASSLSRP